jgi:hypothetical protein
VIQLLVERVILSEKTQNVVFVSLRDSILFLFIRYMALQEVYTIGSVVETDTLGGLGGTVTCLRVIDAFYDPCMEYIVLK